jgi:hypothetical protein
MTGRTSLSNPGSHIITTPLAVGIDCLLLLLTVAIIAIVIHCYSTNVPYQILCTLALTISSHPSLLT